MNHKNIVYTCNGVSKRISEDEAMRIIVIESGAASAYHYYMKLKWDGIPYDFGSKKFRGELKYILRKGEENA